MSNHNKKFVKQTEYVGTVVTPAKTVTFTTTGRTKREATTRLRRAFIAADVPTRPDSFTDLLQVTMSGPPVTKPKATRKAKTNYYDRETGLILPPPLPRRRRNVGEP